jgi:hypothetical protein
VYSPVRAKCASPEVKRSAISERGIPPIRQIPHGQHAGRRTAVTGKENPAGTGTFSACILSFGTNSASKKELTKKLETIKKMYIIALSFEHIIIMYANGKIPAVIKVASIPSSSYRKTSSNGKGKRDRNRSHICGSCTARV